MCRIRTRKRAAVRHVTSTFAASVLILAGVSQITPAANADDPSQPVIDYPDQTADNGSTIAAAPATGRSLREDDPAWPVGAPQMNGTPRHEMIAALARPGVTTECLPTDLKTVIGQIERKWGGVTLISTHRPGARVRGSGRLSRHANCNAIDFRPARGTYRAVASWLKANHNGGVGTYSGRLNHIHIDNGPRYRWHN